MSLLHKPIDQINEMDLINLIETPVYESRLLDYKEQLSGDSSSEKKEFLYDITSFANSGGGELIYGISEERVDGRTTGRPSVMLGVVIQNKDELIRKYENLIRTSVQPRIFGLRMEVVSLSNGKQIFIIRIPNSLNSPHMVTYEGNQRFYIRNSAGKHPMDISEIRSTILANYGLSERINNFRLDRVARIKNNQANLRLINNSHYLLLHIIPFNSFGNEQFPVNVLMEQMTNLPPFFTTGWDYKYNLDGFMTYAKWPDAMYAHSYVQLFRNGIIESVDNGMLRSEGEHKTIPSVKIEKDIIGYALSYFKALKAIGLNPPIVLLISLLGVNEFELGVSQLYSSPDNGGKIEQEDILLPELIIENYPDTPVELAKLLQGTFDTLWNAAGWPRSVNYNSEGNWVGQR
jgi:hypothetical protein